MLQSLPAIRTETARKGSDPALCSKDDGRFGYRTRPLRYWTSGPRQCHLQVIERPEEKASAVTKIDRIDAIIIDVPTVRGGHGSR